MYTQCPSCKIVYHITVEQLRSGKGEALCERCQIAFNTLAALGRTVSEAVPGQTRMANGHLPVLGAHEAVPTARYAQARKEELESFPMPLEDIRHNETPAAAFTVSSPLPGIKFPYRWGSFILMAILAWQLHHSLWPRWLQDPDFRPFLQLACDALGCHLPDYHDLGAISVVERGLYPAADNVDGYEFRLTLLNQAVMPQPYPRIALTLTGLNDEAVAARLFQPQDYLSDSTIRLMPVNQPVMVRLLLATPSHDVNGFTFELHNTE